MQQQRRASCGEDEAVEKLRQRLSNPVFHGLRRFRLLLRLPLLLAIISCVIQCLDRLSLSSVQVDHSRHLRPADSC